MDVTRNNFLQLLPQICKEINECEFLSIDNELTGVSLSGNLFDTHEERYLKKVENEMQYDVIQFGLTLFKNDKTAKKFLCTCYNFYIFYYNVQNCPYKEKNINLQSVSIKFLSDNSFDFNKLFKEGISYLNLEEKKNLIDTLMKKKIKKNFKFEIPKNKNLIVINALQTFNDFLENENENFFEFPAQDRYTNNLIYKALCNEYFLKDSCDSKEIVIKSFENQTSNTFKITLNKIDKKDIIDEEITTEAVGFSKIIHEIIKQRKPLVGHNVLLDLMHIIHQFLAPLPKNYEEFKFILRELFPLVFDTKYMSIYLDELSNQRNLSLSELYFYLKKNYPNEFDNIELINSNFVDIKNEDYNLSTENNNQLNAKFHHAGYDSYITGLCFLALRSKLFSKSFNNIWSDNRVRNKFYNAFSFDIQYFSSETDIKLDRKNVFYIKFNYDPVPFKDILAELNDFKIGNISKNEAFVAVFCEAKAKQLLNMFKCNSRFSILTYSEYTSEKLKQKVDNYLKKNSDKVENNLNKEDVLKKLKRKKKKRRCSTTIKKDDKDDFRLIKKKCESKPVNIDIQVEKEMDLVEDQVEAEKILIQKTEVLNSEKYDNTSLICIKETTNIEDIFVVPKICYKRTN